MALEINNAADNAHIESDDVAAVSVRSTGDRDSKARKTRMDDFITFAMFAFLDLRDDAQHSRTSQVE